VMYKLFGYAARVSDVRAGRAVNAPIGGG